MPRVGEDEARKPHLGSAYRAPLKNGEWKGRRAPAVAGMQPTLSRYCRLGLQNCATRRHFQKSGLKMEFGGKSAKVLLTTVLKAGEAPAVLAM